MTIRVEQGDCLDVMRRLIAEGVIADAIVTDPPYGLEFMGKDWDGANGFRRSLNVADVGRNNAFGRLSATAPEYRTTGENNTQIYQEWCEQWAREALLVLRPGGYLLAFGGTRTYHRLTCAIEDAGFIIQDCVFWLYGTGFPKSRAHLKPAYEPIVMAYKPGGPRTLQVDECRIDGTKRDPGYTNPGVSERRPHGFNHSRYVSSDTLGRWPANICHDGSDEVMAGFPAETGKAPPIGSMGGGSNKHSIYGDLAGVPAARFFYTSKAGPQDRWGSRHPTVKPVGLLRWLVPLVTAPGATVLDPFAGSGTTGIAALATGRSAILIEREAEYIGDIRERLAFYAGDGRHSLASKGRKTAPRGSAPLFEEAP